MQIKPSRTTITALAAAVALPLSALAAAPQAGAATLYVCVKKNVGTARFVSARTRCRRNETKLSWNTPGPAGRNGANGKNGAAGKNGKDGAAGKNGANGTNGLNGASAGLVDFNDSPFELPLTRAAIATLPGVPAGSYVFVAKAELEDANATEAVDVHCYLASDEAVAELAPKGGVATVSLLTAATIPIASAITLECNAFGTKEVKVEFARIAAIQVQALTATSG